MSRSADSKPAKALREAIIHRGGHTRSSPSRGWVEHAQARVPTDLIAEDGKGAAPAPSKPCHSDKVRDADGPVVLH
ncbi:hypothetical protein GCM10027075_13600 [Streptomyces heilongjiangensis]